MDSWRKGPNDFSAIHPAEAQGFSHAILKWYREKARALPWRETSDPYAIWVSEVMLQQTRVETVVPYYHRFLERFPVVKDLAEASEAEVLKEWEGLGYYRRIRLLHQAAREVLKNFHGVIPADPQALRNLPGVGAYMAGAIASIAFNLPEPAVDGNVIRVVSRILAWSEDAFTAKSQRVITLWVRERFLPGAARDFTQSLMELGALVCLPAKPRCPECPVRCYCRAAFGNPEDYPVKKPGRGIPTEERVVLRIAWSGRHLLVQRPAQGLMAGFWEYPNLKSGPDANGAELAAAWTGEWLGRRITFHKAEKRVQTFTHLRWELTFWNGEWPGAEIPPAPGQGGWFLPEEERTLARVGFLREP